MIFLLAQDSIAQPLVDQGTHKKKEAFNNIIQKVYF